MAYFKATTYQAAHDGVPWCAAFVNWCLEASGIKGTRSASAFSFENFGVDSGPCRGAIAVLNYGGGKGHVAFLVGTCKGKYVLLGGNQSNSVCYKTVDKDKVTSFRLPVEVGETPSDPLPELSLALGHLTYVETR